MIVNFLLGKPLLPLAITLFLISLLVSNNLQAQAGEKAAVKSVFAKYKSAILNGNSKAAYSCVDSRTRKYYSDIADKVRNLEVSEVKDLGIIDKITVLSVRHKASAEQIKSFNGETLFKYAISSGMVGKNSVMNLEAGDVSVDKNFARTQVISKGQATPLYFHYYKEANAWKLDLTSIFAPSIAAFNSVIEQSGKEEDTFILDMLEMTSGRKPAASVWDKP